MQMRTVMFVLAGLASLGLAVHAPLPQTALPAPPPTAKADVGQWDAALVQRAAQLVASPAEWNRADTGRCPGAATLSINCALQKAVEESARVFRGPAGPRLEQPPAPSDCRFHPAKDRHEGSCGALFDEVPIFRIARVKAITTGRWRADAQPSEVWAGTMTDAEYPVMYEAERVVTLVTGRKYPGGLVGYNNDPATTFADVQAFFRVLQDQLLKHAASDFEQSFDDVEIEVYAGGAGVIRMYTGWFAVSGLTLRDSMLRFQIDNPAQAVAPNGLDREILQRAAAIITSDAVWNRADTRKCAPAATTWSIYCAEERASIDVTGGFHHRRPALELVREIVDQRSKGKSYSHRLMDYNNDPATRLEDVRSLFAEAIARIK